MKREIPIWAVLKMAIGIGMMISVLNQFRRIIELMKIIITDIHRDYSPVEMNPMSGAILFIVYYLLLTIVGIIFVRSGFKTLRGRKKGHFDKEALDSQEMNQTR